MIRNLKSVFERDVKLGTHIQRSEKATYVKSSWGISRQQADRKEQKAESIKKAREILKGAEVNDDTADAVLIGVYAAKNLRSDN